jgi:solute:Na+ symporter, SSS family
MALFTFLILIGVSIVLALLSRRGIVATDIHQILVGSRGFGCFLLFFVTVGEIYGIGTMIGVPGAVYSRGSSYVVWFLGYILLAYPVGYFLNPRIWRVGKISNSSTISDLFGWRFESKWLGFMVACFSLLFILPWAQMQFVGLSIIVRYLGVHINPTLAVVVASIIAFIYVGLSGIKGSAYVAILKDILMVVAIVIGGITAVVQMPGGLEGIYREAYEKFPTYLTVVMVPIDKNVTFLISTILFQAVGFYCWPFIVQYIFSAGSEKIVRHNQCLMPLYMLMYVFLVTAAFFSLVTVSGLKNPDDSFMGMIVQNLPGWLVGIVAAGGALTCMLVLADVSLAVGGIVSRNFIGMFKPDMSSARSVAWTQVATAVFLSVSVILTIFFPFLLLGLINVAYFGVTQFLPGILSIILWKRVSKWGIGAGLVAGVFCVFLFNVVNIVPFGLNKGLIAMLVNAAVMATVSVMSKPDEKAIEKWKLTLKSSPKASSPGSAERMAA